MINFLEPDGPTRAQLTELVVGYLNRWFEAASTMDAHAGEPDPETVEMLRRPPGEQGRPLEAILEDLTEAGRSGILHPSGGHMSYIPNAGLYTAALAEFLAAGLNRFTGVTQAAPGMVAIEKGVVDWICGLFDLGPASTGLLLSGGSLANFTGIVAARDAHLGDRLGDGVVYMTERTHHSASKAARLAGFRPDQIVTVAVDANLRMDPVSLRKRIVRDRSEGRTPALVVASAGTTDTGTIDPLEGIAEVASSEGIWLHVDAAYGGFFLLTERGRRALAGIDRADSIALDPHKGLSIPFGVGAVVVRDEETLVEAHEGRGGYLAEDDTYMGLRDFSAVGPELSRPFRGLAVWLPLHLHGIAPFRDALDHSLDLAEAAYERLRRMEGIDALWRPDLSIVAFRFEDDEKGKAALGAVNRDRTVHLSPTTIDGRFVLRLAILNRRTTADHVDHALDIIEKTLIG